MGGRTWRPSVAVAATAWLIFAVGLALGLSGCASGPSPGRAATTDAVPRAEPPSNRGNPASYTVFGKRYHVQASNAGFRQRGIASWYGDKFHGRPTSSGEPYDMYQMTAAHKTLRLPAYVRVTNQINGKSVVVRVNDRGPFVGDRIIDLSYAAAHKIGMTGRGTVPVEIEVVGPDHGIVHAATNSAGQGNWQPAALPNARWDEQVFVQVGAFRDRGHAEAIDARLRRAGLTPVRQVEGGLTRVRVGPFASAAAFDSTLERLQALGFHDAIMVVNK
ncbi:MAG TPA: septal ring lytic transglycosylase RlpA family protein [Guyparkeria sp.]|nr:septal ring lytic transglycosylase RlpA family protein [Guyparkeria sp.]